MIIFKRKIPATRLVFYVLLILIIVGVAVGGIWYVRRLKDPVIPASEAIPANPACIIQIRNATAFWDTFSKNSKIWKELVGLSYFNTINQQIRSLDSAIKTDKAASRMSENHDLIIAAYLSGSNEIGHLFLTNLATAHDESAVDDFAKSMAGEKAGINRTEYGRHSITGISRTAKSKAFYYSVSDGIFIGSFSDQLVRDALTTLDKGNPAMRSPEYMKLSSTAGKNCEANIYINIACLPRLLAPLCADSLLSQTGITAQPGSLSEFDLKTKPSEWMLSGYLQTDPGKNNFPYAVSRQKPGKSKLAADIPFNSGIVLSYQFDDFTRFYEDHIKQTTGKQADAVVDALENKYNFSIRSSFFDWISGEMALVLTVSGSENIKDHTFAVFHAINPDKAMKLLDEVSVNSTGSDPEKAGFIDAPGLLPSLFGSVFSNISSCYYMRVNENIVFGNTPQELRNFSASVSSGKTLATNRNYEAFAENLSEKSNIFLYVNTRKSFNILKSFASKAVAASMEKSTYIFRNFEAIGVQVSAEKPGLYYASIYLKYNPLYDDENPAVWETPLDTTIYGRPQVIADHRDSTKKIIVFDIAGNMYLIGHNGNIIWKKALKAKPTSDVWLVDIKKNNEYSLLFATADRLWLIDMDGGIWEKYPVKLPVNTSGPLTVLDPGGRKQYVLLYPGTNKKMNSILLSGNPDKQWTAVALKGAVSDKVVYLKSGGKECFIFWDKTGSIYFTDRGGKTNLKLKTPLKKAVNSPVYIDDTKGAAFLTTDVQGRVVSIAANGNITFTTAALAGASHYFFFEDFDGDGEKDHIFIDNNALTVYDRDKKLLFKHQFSGDIMPVRPVIFMDGTHCRIAVVAPVNDHLILISMHGLYDSLQKYTAQTAPAAAIFFNGERPSMVAGSGKTVRFYATGL